MDVETLRRELNGIYEPLEAKQREIHSALKHGNVRVRTGWFNGHYRKDGQENWTRDTFPIPEVDLIDLCDIEIWFERITVTTKQNREWVLDCTFVGWPEYSFEAYGVGDYLHDYYVPEDTPDDLKARLRESEEQEIGFTFSFPFDTAAEEFVRFSEFLRREGFYY